MKENRVRRPSEVTSFNNQNSKKKSPFAPRLFPENAGDSTATTSPINLDILNFGEPVYPDHGKTTTETEQNAHVVLGGDRNTLTTAQEQKGLTTGEKSAEAVTAGAAVAAKTLPAGAVTFGPIAIVIVGAGLTFGVTVYWLNNGGWEQIGYVANVIARGITGTIEDIREMAASANQAAVAQVDRIEDYLTEHIFFAKKKKGNQSENNEFKRAVQKIEEIIGRKLTDTEKRQLHDEITGQNYTFWEIVITGVERFGTSEDLNKIPRDKWPPGWHPDDAMW